MSTEENSWQRLRQMILGELQNYKQLDAVSLENRLFKNFGETQKGYRSAWGNLSRFFKINSKEWLKLLDSKTSEELENAIFSCFEGAKLDTHKLISENLDPAPKMHFSPDTVYATVPQTIKEAHLGHETHESLSEKSVSHLEAKPEVAWNRNEDEEGAGLEDGDDPNFEVQPQNDLSDAKGFSTEEGEWQHQSMGGFYYQNQVDNRESSIDQDTNESYPTHDQQGYNPKTQPSQLSYRSSDNSSPQQSPRHSHDLQHKLETYEEKSNFQQPPMQAMHFHEDLPTELSQKPPYYQEEYKTAPPIQPPYYEKEFSSAASQQPPYYEEESLTKSSQQPPYFQEEYQTAHQQPPYYQDDFQTLNYQDYHNSKEYTSQQPLPPQEPQPPQQFAPQPPQQFVPQPPPQQFAPQPPPQQFAPQPPPQQFAPPLHQQSQSPPQRPQPPPQQSQPPPQQSQSPPQQSQSPPQQSQSPPQQPQSPPQQSQSPPQNAQPSIQHANQPPIQQTQHAHQPPRQSPPQQLQHALPDQDIQPKDLDTNTEFSRDRDPYPERVCSDEDQFSEGENYQPPPPFIQQMMSKGPLIPPMIRPVLNSEPAISAATQSDHQKNDSDPANFEHLEDVKHSAKSHNRAGHISSFDGQIYQGAKEENLPSQETKPHGYRPSSTIDSYTHPVGQQSMNMQDMHPTKEVSDDTLLMSFQNVLRPSPFSMSNHRRSQTTNYRNPEAPYALRPPQIYPNYQNYSQANSIRSRRKERRRRDSDSVTACSSRTAATVVKLENLKSKAKTLLEENQKVREGMVAMAAEMDKKMNDIMEINRKRIKEQEDQWSVITSTFRTAISNLQVQNSTDIHNNSWNSARPPRHSEQAEFVEDICHKFDHHANQKLQMVPESDSIRIPPKVSALFGKKDGDLGDIPTQNSPRKTSPAKIPQQERTEIASTAPRLGHQLPPRLGHQLPPRLGHQLPPWPSQKANPPPHFPVNKIPFVAKQPPPTRRAIPDGLFGDEE